jgi:hypothetical protein
MPSGLAGKVAVFAVGFAIILVPLLTQKGERRRGMAFILAWFVPGAGHVALGKWKKGLFFFVLLGVTYLLGMWMVGFRSVAFDDNPFYFVGQYGSGATLLLAKTFCAEKAFPRPDFPPSWFDPGLLYVCVVGLLNIVVMLNVLDLRLGSAPSAGPAAAPVPSGTPAAPDTPSTPGTA